MTDVAFSPAEKECFANASHIVVYPKQLVVSKWAGRLSCSIILLLAFPHRGRCSPAQSTPQNALPLSPPDARRCPQSPRKIQAECSEWRDSPAERSARVG